ncbi:MAG: serine/threonine protein kinase [bacterium]|nr:serine/threonine protein kinase [bacterium]
MVTASGTLKVPGYLVVQLLGNGANSTIWQIRHLSTGKLYALKRVVKLERNDYRYFEQVETEYANSLKLDHPNLRKIYDIKRIRKWFSVNEIHLRMEYCSGETIQNVRPQNVSDVVAIFAKVASALDHMNSRGIIHADIKPNNIVLNENNEVKVIDLGQSCSAGMVKERIQGTPDFIAPEQVQRHPLDARTDVFNFGASLYWTLAGRPIPTSLSLSDSIRMKQDTTMLPLNEINKDVPPSLCKLINDCVEPVPSRRPGSMKDVLSRLDLVALTMRRKPTNNGLVAEDR